MRQAIAERQEALRGFGIERDDPRKGDKLRGLERQTVGKGMAAQTGQQFLAAVPDGFRGRVQAFAGPTLADGYTVVSDGKCFVVLRSTPALRTLHGQSVVVARGATGRLVVRPDPDRDLGR